MVMFNLVLVHLMIIFLHMIIIFNNGEIVEYSTTGTVASGLSTTTQYAVKVIDTNKFKLCDVGVSSQRNLTNYDKNKNRCNSWSG